MADAQPNPVKQVPSQPKQPRSNKPTETMAFHSNTAKTVNGAEILETSYKGKNATYRSVTVKASSNDVDCPHTHHHTSIFESSVNFLKACGIGLHMVTNTSQKQSDNSFGSLFYEPSRNAMLFCDEGGNWIETKSILLQETRKTYPVDAVPGTIFYDIETYKLLWYNGNNWFMFLFM